MNSLIGKWNLLEYISVGPDGLTVSLSQDQVGQLEYLENGKMRVSIQRSEARLKELGLKSRLANIQYSGTFSIDEKNSFVRHHVEQANEANRIGTVLTRSYCLNGDRLEISAASEGKNVKLIWNRIKI